MLVTKLEIRIELSRRPLESVTVHYWYPPTKDVFSSNAEIFLTNYKQKDIGPIWEDIGRDLSSSCTTYDQKPNMLGILRQTDRLGFFVFLEVHQGISEFRINVSHIYSSLGVTVVHGSPIFGRSWFV